MFWVTRERIRARPRRYYERLYAAVTDAHHPLLGMRGKAIHYASRTMHNFFMEGYWHYIFGEPEVCTLPFETYEDIPNALPPPLPRPQIHCFNKSAHTGHLHLKWIKGCGPEGS